MLIRNWLESCGQLLTVPEEHHFPGIRKQEQGLPEVGCESWEGHVFVNLAPAPRPSLRDYLGEEIWNGYEGFFKCVMTLTAEVRVNWKLFLDALVESYHLSTVHRWRI